MSPRRKAGRLFSRGKRKLPRYL